MAPSNLPQRFALLVGVDYYMNDNSRRQNNGEPVFLGNLKGCVRDVEIIRDLLQTGFNFDHPRILTSSAAPDEPGKPLERQNDQPTFSNIKKELDKVYEQARAGDLFLFHFSGHGAHLKTTLESPTGRNTDPSLMTSDYCCGQPAIRGWQFNDWLRRFHDKRVRVLVLLDSCHSGGAWRTGRQLRTPEDWTPPPNLPADEAAVQGTQSKPGSRKGDIEVSWDINPEGFTLMAACRADQQAEEINLGNATCGAFTAAVKEYFQTQSRPSTATYRTIREYVASKIELQDPQVFGRDRLLFFGNQEPFSVTPTFAEMRGDAIFLPLGISHGIAEGAEFTTYPPAPRLILSVRKVQDFESEVQVLEGQIETLRKPIGVIPFRWSCTGILKVYVDSRLGQRFREQLKLGLQERVAGDIAVTASTAMPIDNSIRNICFWLTTEESGNISMFGPEALLGYQGPVRGWKIRHQGDDESRAADAAITLAHLTRFMELLRLRNNSSQDSPPFTVTLDPDPNGQLYPNQQKFKFTIQNHESIDLLFTVSILSSGFHAKQLYPPCDAQQVVPPNKAHSFSFKLEIPEKLRCDKIGGEQTRYRDIVRVVATRGRVLSLKTMELPDIWSADRVDYERRANTGGRDGTVETDCSWWVQDCEVWLGATGQA